MKAFVVAAVHDVRAVTLLLNPEAEPVAHPADHEALEVLWSGEDHPNIAVDVRSQPRFVEPPDRCLSQLRRRQVRQTQLACLKGKLYTKLNRDFHRPPATIRLTALIASSLEEL